MLWLLTAVLATAAVPPDVDLDDLDHWEESAEVLLDGPAGCWEVVGHASWKWDVGRFGASRGDAIFVGRLVDGVWSEFHLEPLGEVVREKKGTEVRLYGLEPRFVPLFGSVGGGTIVIGGDGTDAAQKDDRLKSAEEKAADERVEARRVRREERRAKDDADEIITDDSGAANVLREALNELSGDATTSWTKWDNDKGAVQLQRQVPIGDQSRAPIAKVDVYFPDAGLPNAMDVVFPEEFFGGSFPKWRVHDAVVYLRGRPSGGEVFPRAESFSFGFGVFGFKFSGAQTIQYRSAVRCERPASIEPNPAITPVETAAPVGDTTPANDEILVEVSPPAEDTAPAEAVAPATQEQP